jgi:ornithine cyclodeaminase/alanine dehydrogenase-like protein (mu-crystallin family)
MTEPAGARNAAGSSGSAPPRWIGAADVRRLLPMAACIEAVAEALIALSRGAAEQPLRTVLAIPGGGSLYVMPAATRSPRALVTKLITVVPGNEARGLPSHQGVLLVFDPDSGEASLCIDAAAVTAIRTAAASAVATRLLARRDARILALIGSGVQAHTHLEAIASVCKLEEVRVWSPTRSHRTDFAQATDGARGVRVHAVDSAESAVRGADIVCTLTASGQPVVLGEWLGAGCHINAVGASTAGARELDGEAVRRSRIFVDHREAAGREAGDLLLAAAEGAIGLDAIVAELGEVLDGRQAGRRADDEITLFKSLGQAVEDAAAAALIGRSLARAGQPG